MCFENSTPERNLTITFAVRVLKVKLSIDNSLKYYIFLTIKFHSGNLSRDNL